LTESETAFIKGLLEMEMEGLSLKEKTKVRMAFHSNKITFENLQACLDKIAKWQSQKL
tara:strand:- start:432 stop:605 length:174 start_codon:yes stop_codon:yes gene_type:complete